jgi:BMFP domain-containing protein YqiC
MINPKLFDELSQRIVEGMPKNLQILQDDLERNLRMTLESTLRQMNLVSRDEFEIQQAVLMRTREKLAALEKRVAELEQQSHTP